MGDSATPDPELAHQAIASALRFRRFAVQFLWLPLTFFVLILGIGFHTFFATYNYPVWIDTLLNAMTMAFAVSLGLIPIGYLALYKCKQLVQGAAVDALAANCADLIPLRQGEFLGEMKVARLTSEKITLVHPIIPVFQRRTANFTFVASAFSLPAIFAPPPSTPLIASILSALLVYGLIAIALGLANTTRVIDISLVQGEQRVRDYFTVTKWNWPRFGEWNGGIISESCADELGRSMCHELWEMNKRRLAIARGTLLVLD